MTRGGPRCIALAAVLALLSACSSSTESTDAHVDGDRMDGGTGGVRDGGLDGDVMVAAPPEPPSALTRARFFEERRRLICTHLVRCGARDRRQEICHPAVDDAWESLHEAAAVAGTSRFDPEGGLACLEALTRAVVFCSSELILFPDADPEESWLDEACDHAFVGSLAEGERCEVGAGECAPGLSCRPELGARCWRPEGSEVGGSCAIDLDCGSVEDELSAYYCGVEGTCQLRGAVGEVCTTGSCATNLWCDSGRCATLPGAGAPCDVAAACAGGTLVCVDGACARGAAVGESCATWPCQEGLACRGDELAATCRTTDGRHEGDACWVIVGRLGSNCRDGLHCRADEWIRFAEEERGLGECVDGGGLREPCSALEPCARGLRCIDASCLRAAVVGGSCIYDGQCPLHHYCDDGACRPDPDPVFDG